jgi:hypothetical protein
MADRQQVQLTLDEPVTATLQREVVAIATKFYYVFVPHRSRALLNDWDLWGQTHTPSHHHTITQSHHNTHTRRRARSRVPLRLAQGP